MFEGVEGPVALSTLGTVVPVCWLLASLGWNLCLEYSVQCPMCLSCHTTATTADPNLPTSCSMILPSCTKSYRFWYPFDPFGLNHCVFATHVEWLQPLHCHRLVSVDIVAELLREYSRDLTLEVGSCESVFVVSS